MKQKDLRTRVAEVEAEAKAQDFEGIETEEEDEESSKIVPIIMIIVGLVMAGITWYILMDILKEIK